MDLLIYRFCGYVIDMYFPCLMIVNGNTHKLFMCVKMDNITIDFYQIIIKLNYSLLNTKNITVFFYMYFIGLKPFSYSRHFRIICINYCFLSEFL